MATADVLPTPDGSAVPWVFDHYLRYPGSYEIPLRTMFSLNCKPTKKSPQPSGKRLAGSAFSSSSNAPPPSLSSSSSSYPNAISEFRAQLETHIARLPCQPPCALPPSFMISFLRRCFAANLSEVDFPQALTGLDHLRDLENRRRREVFSTLTRLGVAQEDAADEQSAELARNYRGVLAWVESIQRHERQVESLYSQVYIGLRRWVSKTFLLSFPFLMLPLLR